MGYLDPDGWLFLSDRKADMIISGGVNIYPAEIEAVLLGHPDVADAAVIGVPDDEWGEQVKAVIQAKDPARVGDAFAEEPIAFCRERLAAFKCPRSVDFRDQLHRYSPGQLYKRLIRAEYWADRERALRDAQRHGRSARNRLRASPATRRGATRTRQVPGQEKG